MSICISPNFGVSLATLALLAVSLGTTQARAQATVAAPAKPDTVAMPKAMPQSYRSALEGYQPYTDEKTVNWKVANDTVSQIGGWRAYSKEASQDPSADKAVKPALNVAPAKP